MSQARALHRVQVIELEVIKLTRRIKAINVELEDQTELEQVREDFLGAEERLTECRKLVNEVELQIQAVTDKRQATEERLYDGSVTNTKELQDMQMEVESLTRRFTQLDEQLSKHADERDAAKTAHDEIKALLEETTTKHQARLDELQKEKAELKQKADGLLAERRAALKQVEEPALKLYNGMRATKSNRPVAVLRDNACTICGIEQNRTVIVAINHGEQLVNCNSCGRILVKL